MVTKKRTLEVDDSAAYLRSKKPLRATRGVELPDWPYRRIFAIALGLTLAVSSVYAVNVYVSSNSRFRVDPRVGNPQVAGLNLLDGNEIRRIFADDLGLAINAVDIEARREQVEQLDWVRRASVGRIWPNRIAIYIEERTPAAFLRLPGKGGLRLIDSAGVILAPIEGKQFDLPVAKGIDSSMSEGERKIRMDLLGRLMDALDSEQPKLSEFISEVDISNPKNAVVSALYKGEMVELQMGDEHLRHRFEVFLKYVDTWIAEFGPVKSADLRFEDQVAVTPVRRR